MRHQYIMYHPQYYAQQQAQYHQQLAIEQESSSEDETSCSESESSTDGSTQSSGSSDDSETSCSESESSEYESSESEPEPVKPVKKRSKDKKVKEAKTKEKTVKKEEEKPVVEPPIIEPATVEPVVKREKKSRKSKKVEEVSDESEDETPVISPGQHIFKVISEVLRSGDKKVFKNILSKTPLPIALHYMHHITQLALSVGDEGIEKVILSTNKKYNIVSDVYIDAFKKGDVKYTNSVMEYFTSTVDAFKTAKKIDTENLLKYFTPEFIAMNLIQAGNIELYDSVMTDFKSESVSITRGFHTAKPLMAAYFGTSGFFSNQKRYTFNREIIVMSICGGSTETLDYIVKKLKNHKIKDDIVMEARACHPISAGMAKHLKKAYGISRSV